MANVVERGWKVTGARNCVELEIEYPMGGHSEILYAGADLQIETKYGNIYVGSLVGLKRATSEGEMDSLVIFTSEGIKNVGIHDIAYMGVEANGRMD